MKILLVVATFQEIQPFINHYTNAFDAEKFITIGQHEIKILITGVGMVSTAYALGNDFARNSYDLAINVGIAGSFYRKIALGELVEVQEDILSELGAEDDEEFIDLSAMGLGEITFAGSYQSSLLKNIKKVVGITVNTVHGNTDTIENIRERVNPTVETMEGAAFFYACEESGTPALQIRSISNYVERRNTANWQIPLAIKKLNDWLIKNITAI